MSSNNPPPPGETGSPPSGSSSNAPASLFSMNFFVPLNPAAPGQAPTEGASMTWTMHISTQPPAGHPAAASSATSTNGFPSVGLQIPTLPIPLTMPFPPFVPNSTSAPPGAGAPTAQGPVPAFFPNFAMPGFFARPEPQPDPAKAKELLKSLPSVSREMMKRIDRICDAEEPESEEKGWRCGVCMEGVADGVEGNEGMDEETGVKALPCNHLFHESCLEPWFATKHTWLDLDPLRTMRSSSSQSSGGRARGPARAGYHPFRRDAMPVPPQSANVAPATASTASTAAPSDSETTAPAQPAITVDPDEQVDVETRFSFTFRIPTPPPPGTAAPGDAGPAPAGAANGTSTPPFPSNMFGQRIHTSPSPMSRNRSQEANPPPPVPVFVPGRPPGFDGNMPINMLGAVPFPMGGPIPPLPAPAAIPPANAHAHAQMPNGHIHAPRPQRPQVVVHHNHSPPPPGQAPPPFVPSDFHPPMVPPQIIHVFHGPPPPERPSAPAPKSTFVPKPLEDWVLEREKALGWRRDCDAPECEYAPQDDEAVDQAASESSKRESSGACSPALLSLYAPPSATGEVTAGKEESVPMERVKTICSHRYHPACLESMERSAGRWNVQEDGKVYVRCARCRKDGWVTAPDAEDEAIVEKGCLVEA